MVQSESSSAVAAPDFAAALARHGLAPLKRAVPDTLQINVGRQCNQACRHCHVDAGPNRKERMEHATAERVIELLAASPSVKTVDLTGGAPELNPNFRYLVEQSRAFGRNVKVRCNLTVLFAPGMEDMASFYRDQCVELVCSLPCYGPENVERQRGPGVFDKSIQALQLLNRLGYGSGALSLDLVYNPVGDFLPPPQAELEAQYREHLRARFGIEFRRLLTLTNMPIRRFAAMLRREGRYAAYLDLLVNNFNPATVGGLMCRTLVSVGWEGGLYDCDFNLMLEMPIGASVPERPLTVFDCSDFEHLENAAIATARHCFGCTAGAGSSCSGALT